MESGHKYGVSVTYPSNAFHFDPGKKYDNGYYINYGRILLPFFLTVCIIIALTMFRSRVSRAAYDATAGFGNFTGDKIIRMKILYHAQCPDCGTSRPAGKEKCPICGCNLIMSAEPLDESTIKKEDPEALKYRNAGICKYTSEPNTYIRVRVESGTGRRSGYHAYAHTSHFSCAHSSCACACACAGGGRAGCSTKDFYDTNLKLRHIAHATAR